MNAPKPSAIRLMEGMRGHRPLNDREPVALIGAPTMPSHLDALARREWRKLVPLLLAMRVLAESDGLALATLCSNSANIIRAQTELAKSKSLLIATGPNGYRQQHPLISVLHSEQRMLIVLLREFGLTPSSRTRVEANQSSGDMDALEMKLCGDL